MDPEKTLWTLMRDLSNMFGVPMRDMHLALGNLLPPPCMKIKYLVPNKKMALTLIVHERVCKACGRSRPGSTCGICCNAWYCSDACVRLAGEAHSLECRRGRQTPWALLYAAWLAGSEMHY